MNEPDYKRGLYIVRANGHENAPAAEDSHLPFQVPLFPYAQKRILVFVTVPLVSDLMFQEVLTTLMPPYVVDVRQFPRFDFGALNRRLAFDWFAQAHSRYIDLVWTAETKEIRVSEEVTKAQGPIMILVEPKQSASDVLDRWAAHFFERTALSWEVMSIPPGSAAPISK